MNTFKKLTPLLLLATISSTAFAITDAQLFAYAEANYSSFFPGTPTAGQYQQYDYRYYPASQNYLAVDTSGAIYVLGPVSGGAVAPVGTLTAFASTVTAWEVWQATQATSVVNHFVAPDGNDSVDSGAFGKPYKTIDYCAKTARSGEVCQIRKGTYRETVRPNSGIIITAYKDEQVTVDGSDPVKGWTLVPGSSSIYSANVSASAVMSTDDMNQVFVRDPLLPEGKQMMTEARWPNGDDLFHVNWATLKAGTTATQLVDSSLPNINWTGAKIHFWSGDDPWAPQTGVVTASPPATPNSQLTFGLDGTPTSTYIIPMGPIVDPVNPTGSMLYGYYYLFGTLAALDAPREWFYDRSAGKLYFWAPGGVNPDTLDVRVKQRQFAFDLSGRSNVTIQNINLFASTINTDASSASNTIDGITAKYVSHYTTIHDRLDPDTGKPVKSTAESDHLYDTGIIINGSGNQLLNSTISYSAGNGVTVSGTNNTVQNNLIHHVDYMANEPSGVTFRGTGQIQKNTIHSSGRYAIYADSSGSLTPLTVDISNNNLYNAMMLSRDGSAIYVMPPAATMPPGATGSRIHHNWTHDTQSLYPGAAAGYVLAGVYLDLDASGWKVDQNVLWNNQNHNIFLHGDPGGDPATPRRLDPNNNNISNNSIVDVGINAGIRLADIVNCGSTQIIGNKVMLPVTQGADALPANTTISCDLNHESTNNSTALGANEMTSSVKVGCDFAGCSSDGPPLISGSSVAASIATQPYDLTVTAGQPATFSVTGAGSAPLSFQWKKNGVDISGATTTGASSSYKIPATTSADNRAVFTVRVTNPFGSIDSVPATLTVQ